MGGAESRQWSEGGAAPLTGADALRLRACTFILINFGGKVVGRSLLLVETCWSDRTNGRVNGTRRLEIWTSQGTWTYHELTSLQFSTISKWSFLYLINAHLHYQELDRLLRCSICFEYFKTAVMMPNCSHNCESGAYKFEVFNVSEGRSLYYLPTVFHP